ncbi:sigma-70 family RNA polymerase sigma factor [Clostridium sp. C105KSO13]|uniref:sigma-70 family RNA polymerase sigma factor n=1 Tax=Clostridium sp. C105KSO13 TaxID=1776045 RepID=UPI0007406DB1|nr:sigma-70 family RNA polymerase sigma factor [Clostridium sp. C105KSO13]CUX25415.1 Sigma-70, region 4 [Clostridium sp. C105KSO13]
MKKLHTLTTEQRHFADLHHNLVYSFLNENKLEESEFYDVAVFGYLLAVQEYLERPELARLKFSTIAWTRMKNCVAGEFQYRNRQKRRAIFEDYNEEVSSMTLDDLLPNRMDAIAETLDNQEQLLRLLCHLTPKEKEAVYLKADGYTYREIGELCCITVYGVGSRFSRLRRRLRELSLI